MLQLALIWLWLCTGCAHDGSLRPGAMRTLVVAGTLITVAGVVTAAGCTDAFDDEDGCSGRPEDADLAVGLSAVAVGGAMLGTAALYRPSGQPSPLAPRNPLPPPVLPDPFDKPLTPRP